MKRGLRLTGWAGSGSVTHYRWVESLELLFDSVYPGVEELDCVGPGLAKLRGVSGIEVAGMGLFEGSFCLCFFESLFEVCESFFQVFFAHRERLSTVDEFVIRLLMNGQFSCPRADHIQP